MDGYSTTYYTKLNYKGKMAVMSFYREYPGGWKLNIEDKLHGDYCDRGDNWVHTIDDLIVQIYHITDEELTWYAEDTGEPISFYEAVKKCALLEWDLP